jgi:SAM-dependent methyltransferase
MSQDLYQTGEYLQKHPDWHVGDAAWKASQVLRILERNRIRPRTLCDIGCGAGEVLNQLLQRMPRDVAFVGYEVSPQAFELSRAREKDRLSFRLTDPFQETSRYDVALAMDVVEHVEDCFTFLRNLRDKGEFKVVHFPLDMSAQAVLRSSPITIQRRDAGHLHYFMKDTALALMADSGHQTVDWFYTRGAPTKLSWKGRLARLPRQLFFKLSQDLAVRAFGGFSLLVLAR